MTLDGKAAGANLLKFIKIFFRAYKTSMSATQIEQPIIRAYNRTKLVTQDHRHEKYRDTIHAKYREPAYNAWHKAHMRDFYYRVKYGSCYVDRWYEKINPSVFA